MRTRELIDQIQRLPLSDRIYVAEKTIHSIRKQEDILAMKNSADTLLADYESNKELSSFTDLDYEDFYDAMQRRSP